MNLITVSPVLAASLFTATSAIATDTIAVFHRFVDGNYGNEPNSLVQASNGNFYGTTYFGVGTVFLLSTHNFQS